MRIAPARDGGICRVRLPGGVLSAAQARALAAASRIFGNGIIELTNRANVQLRGIGGTPGLPDLQDAPAALVTMLTDSGLGPRPSVTPSGTPEDLTLAATRIADLDAVRNILISPTAGTDPQSVIDTRPLLKASLDHLARAIASAHHHAGQDSDDPRKPLVAACDETPHPITDDVARAPLSAKFAIQIDGGEALSVLGHHHDIWLCALDPRYALQRSMEWPGDTDTETARTGHWFAFGLASAIPCVFDDSNTINAAVGTDVSTAPVTPPSGHDTATPLTPVTTDAGDCPLGLVAAHDVPALIEALVVYFLRQRASGKARDAEGRMAGRLRDLLPRHEIGARRVFVDAALSTTTLKTVRPVWLSQWRRPRPASDAARRIGLLPQRTDIPIDHAVTSMLGLPALGVHAALGRLTPHQLDTLAALSDHIGDGTLRVTPWQGILLPNVRASEHELASTLETLHDVEVIVDHAASITRLHACAGSTGCAKGHADTKRDAVQLAMRLSGRVPQVSIHVSGCERRCASAVTRRFTLVATAPGRYALHASSGRERGEVLQCADVDIDGAADRILKETA